MFQIWPIETVSLSNRKEKYTKVLWNNEDGHVPHVMIFIFET